MLRRVLLSVVLLQLSSFGAAGAGTYWATDEGAVLTFGWYSVLVHSNGDQVSHTRLTTPNSGTTDIYRIATDGDLWHQGGHYVCAGQGEGFDYDPPYQLLDLPLDTGKTWSTTTVWRDPNYGSNRMIVSGEVLGPTTTTVPGLDGDVPVIAVRLRIAFPDADGYSPLEDSEAIALLHEQLGAVNGLTAWQGVVPVEPRSWGDVKALFR